MLEDNLRTLFLLEASADAPASNISVPGADRSALRRQRQRRAMTIAAPVFAAAAVAGIAVSATLLGAGTSLNAGSGSKELGTGSGTGRGDGVSPQPSHLPSAAPGDFDPTRVYASFGWLPAGVAVVGGGTGRSWEFLNAGSGWSLQAFAPGQCRTEPVDFRVGQTELTCSQNPDGSPLTFTGSAAAINGYPAYWSGGYLVWRYSAKGWAMLQYPYTCPHGAFAHCRVPTSPTAVRVAEHAEIGTPAAAIRFPAELTGLSRNWSVADVQFSRQAGLDVVDAYQIAPGAEVLPPAAGQLFDTPTIYVNAASSSSVCSFGPFIDGHRTPRPVSETINGYRVLIDTITAGQPQQQLCAQDADGLYVVINMVSSRPALSATGTFQRMRLLGTDPARWTTKPIG